MKRNVIIAKDLRKRATEAEKLVWYRLRLKQLDGNKFRRQEPIGKYIVDFVCFEKKIVIELDGGQHAMDKRKDTERDAWLGEQGFKVLRFWDNEVLNNLEGVMEMILGNCTSPSPSPSHPGRGKEVKK